MSKKIVWSPLSESDLENTLSYLQIHWNNQVVTRFLDLIDAIVAQISINPKQLPIANKKKKRTQMCRYKKLHHLLPGEQRAC